MALYIFEAITFMSQSYEFGARGHGSFFLKGNLWLNNDVFICFFCINQMLGIQMVRIYCISFVTSVFFILKNILYLRS